MTADGDTLRAGLDSLGLPVTADRLAILSGYLDLLQHWNRVHNLTAITDRGEMVTTHVLDSLSILPYLKGKRILDVGSGAGLPGIPLSLWASERQFTLLDASAKRVRFLRQCIATLGLHNVEAVHERVERYTPAQRFDTVTSRAFAALADFVSAAKALTAPDGYLVAMKGRYPKDELSALPQGVRVIDVHALAVPGLDAERHVVILAWGAMQDG